MPIGPCASRRLKLKVKPQPQWNGWSPSANNSRYQSTQAGGLTIDGVQRLKLKWAFAYDGDTTAFAQPTILDGNLFAGSAGGVIHALDAKTGCIHWTYDARGPVRSSILAVRRGKGYSLLFGDQLGWFYSLDATTGKELWKKKVDEHDAARLTGSPVEYDGTVFVPVASWEENRASAPITRAVHFAAASLRCAFATAHWCGELTRWMFPGRPASYGDLPARRCGRRLHWMSRAGCCTSPPATTIPLLPPR